MSPWDQECFVFLDHESARPAPVCIFVLHHVSLIKQSLCASRFVVTDWGVRDATARRPWRRTRFRYRRSTDCPKTDFLSAPVLGAFSRLSQRWCGSGVSHTHGRLICEMCEDHRLVECRLRSDPLLKMATITRTIIIYLKLNLRPPLAHLHLIAWSGENFLSHQKHRH